MVKELQKKFIFAAMAAVTILLLTLVGATNLLNLVSVDRQQKRMLELLIEADGKPAERFLPVDFDRSGAGSRRQNGRFSPSTEEGGQASTQQDTEKGDGAGGKGLPPDRNGGQDFGRRGIFDRRISADDAMSTRFFSVWLDEDGQIQVVDTTQIYAVTEDGARQMAQEILSLKKESGRIRGFRFLLRDRKGEDEMEAFSSASGEASSQEQAVEKTSGTLSASGMLLVVMDVSGNDENLLLVLGISAMIAALCWAAMLLPVRLLAKRAIAPTAMGIERQKQFVTNAGHELKTPLAIILANTEALELYNGESKWTRNIRAQTVRLSDLMQNLLTLSKMDENALQLERMPFDLEKLSREVWENFAQSAAARDLLVDFSTETAGKVSALGDRESVSQLLSILFDNAVKYAPQGGRISIQTALEGKEAVLTQSNTLAKDKGGGKGSGSGIPEDPERLFERFYRTDEDRSRKKGGFGIGLSAARAIAAANRGTIRADRGAGVIRFTLRIPKAQGES